jgi:hypothetical protein
MPGSPNEVSTGNWQGPLRYLYKGLADQGLDQDFNSLDAQYEAASAYIKSQAHAGWTLIRSRYSSNHRPR